MNIIYHSSYLVDYNVVMLKSDRSLDFAVFYFEMSILSNPLFGTINNKGNDIDVDPKPFSFVCYSLLKVF